MKKIEAQTLEKAYELASKEFSCSITELDVVITQHPKKGFLGLLRQSAIIVVKNKEFSHESVDPQSLNQDQDDEHPYSNEYEDDYNYSETSNVDDELVAIASEVQDKINNLFSKLCYDIDEIVVSVYDNNTLLLKFDGKDVALIIGKEGYRYKAISYILFNWINSEYQLQIRLEIAEFLQNQEESMDRYLEGVYENIDRDGSAQTKTLDGVLVQIALRNLRERYHDKYVAVRTTKDNEKYIVINDYHSY